MPNWDTPGLTWDMPGLFYDDPAPWPQPLNIMANQTKPLSLQTLADDKASIEACAKITTYAPTKAIYNQAALDSSTTALTAAEKIHTQAEADLKSARDNMVTAQWNRHNLVLGMRSEIKVQFGDSSNELQAVGLKKKTEYKKGGKKKTATPPAK